MPASSSTSAHGLVVAITNPTKIDDPDTFHDSIRSHAEKAGYAETVFLDTTPNDPGIAMAQTAIERQASLVVAAGGDGTVRAVAATLTNSGIPCAIIPMGTGNLLARNLDIPLDANEAIEVAFSGQPSSFDLVKLYVDDSDEPIWFAGMAGIGFDAAMMADTDETVKSVIGTGAYLVSFINQLGTEPHRLRYRIDDDAWITTPAVMTMVGNTRLLTAGIELFPSARHDDGVLNMMVASPVTLRGWAKVIAAVLRKKPSPAVRYHEGRSFEFVLDEPILWEIDGDTMDTGSRFRFEVVPGALQVVSPAQ